MLTSKILTNWLLFLNTYTYKTSNFVTNITGNMYNHHQWLLCQKYIVYICFTTEIYMNFRKRWFIMIFGNETNWNTTILGGCHKFMFNDVRR